MFKDGKLNQQSMYEGLKAAYDKLSLRYGLRIIPSGDAYQAARKLPRFTFTFPIRSLTTPTRPGLIARSARQPERRLEVGQGQDDQRAQARPRCQALQSLRTLPHFLRMVRGHLQ